MQADGDGDASFEISEEAPASQTSIVVDDAWPSEKEKNRRAVMKAPCGPRKSERKVQRSVFLRLFARSRLFLQPPSLSLSRSLTLSLNPKKHKREQQNIELVLAAIVVARVAIESVRRYLERRRKRRRGGAAGAAPAA
jgi:hypothetical protein